MKRCALVILILLNVLPAFGQDEPAPLNVYHGEIPEGERILYVAPEGDNTHPGTEAEPWATLDYAVSQVQKGDVIVMRGGVYYHDDTIRINSSSGSTDDLTVLTAYPGEVPILDFSSQPKERNYHGVRLNANWWHVIGITIRNASHNGIRMDGWYNILEQITAYGNHDSGIHMAGGASYNVIKNSDSFHNFNFDTARTPRVGNNADGFSAKFEIGPGNIYKGCRAWENSDDGFDLWRAEGTITIENSWAFGNGDASVFGDPANFEGNGNGFKLGGDNVRGDHIVRRSMAFNNFGSSGNAKGFDYNNNPGAMTLVHNTAYNNGRNYFFPLPPPEGAQSFFLNNLSASADLLAYTPQDGAVLAGNSWEFDIEITDDMFVSVDTERAKGPREPDGSLPDFGLLEPVPGSFPVDYGIAIGEPFYGSAPDIGAHEIQMGSPVEPYVSRGSGAFITDLTVYDMEHADEWAIVSDLDAGDDAFGDGSFAFSPLPGALTVDEWIQTSSETRTKNYLLSAAEFTLNQPNHVVIAHSDDISPKPEWLSEYVETSVKLAINNTDGGEHLMTLYRRAVEGGEVVTLGRNSTDGDEAAPMYIAMVGSLFPVLVEDNLPSLSFSLRDVYPNPVSKSATITFSLAGPANVTIKMYNNLGREIALLTDGQRAAGAHSVEWNAQSLPSGVYFCHMAADGFSSVRKLVRIK